MRTKLLHKFQTVLKRIKNFFEAYFKGEIKIRLWVKIFILIGLLIISLLAGLIFGYGVIGDGDKFEVLKPSTWTHILDFVRE